MVAPSRFRLLGWFFAALLVLLWFSLPWSPHTKLTFAGMLLEIFGIAMLGWDVVARLGREAWAKWGPVLARLFHRKRRFHHHLADAIVTGGGSISAVVTAQGLERQVERLIEQVGHLERWRSEELPRELDERLTGLRNELRGAFESGLIAVETRYLGVRITGLAVALAGSVVLAAANLL